MSLEHKESSLHLEQADTATTPHKVTKHGVVLVPQPSDSPLDPLNWPLSKKLLILGILSFSSCISLTQMLANQAGFVAQATVYNVTPVKISYSVTAAIAGSMVGPLIWTPTAQYLGRSSVIFWTSLATTMCIIWSALMTEQEQYIAFVVSRLLSGFFGTASLTLGAGVLLDIFFLHQRGKAFACYAMTALLGSLLAPVTSGFITESVSWTIQFWWCTGAMFFNTLLIFFFLEDTTYDRNNPANNPAPMSRLRNRVATFCPGYRMVQNRSKASVWSIYLIAICPPVLVTGLGVLLTFGWVVGVNTTLAIFLQTPVEAGGYGFTPSQNACFVFTQWVALAVAELYGYLLSDRAALWVCRRGGGLWKPEYRLLPMLIPPMIALPVGLALFGITLQYHLHYMVLATALFLASFADIVVVPVATTYLAECFRNYGTETFTIIWIYRLMLGVALPFFILQWIERNGPAWVFGIMAMLAVVGMSLLVMLFWTGSRLRQYSLRQFIETEEGVKVVEKNMHESK